MLVQMCAAGPACLRVGPEEKEVAEEEGLWLTRADGTFAGGWQCCWGARPPAEAREWCF